MSVRTSIVQHVILLLICGVFFAQNLLTGNVENLQEFCRVNNHIFFKLRTVSCLLDENEDLQNLLEQLNLPPLTKKNGVDLKKEIKKIGEEI